MKILTSHLLFIVCLAPATWALNQRDVNQTKNLYNEYPEVVKEMEARLATYRPKG